MMLIISTSDPSAASVAPYGGLRPVFTPNPLAVGIPTSGNPILVDMSSSITTNGLSSRLFREGRRFPGKWAQDAAGTPTDDPAVLFAKPEGSILPVGGADHGYKGYGLSLAVEALTQGLSGFGRAETPSEWGAAVYIQAMDPASFSGLDNFRREMDWIAHACNNNPPISPNRPVKLPGQDALELRRASLMNGVHLYPGIIESLIPWSQKFGVELPSPL
jgi:LDH2 family malate/lactate/ureidoglycolate dehydrogenase